LSSSASSTWTWQSGFTVLTGETGAGKSILIDACNWSPGPRRLEPDPRGRSRTEVSAEFDHPAITAWLDNAGFATDACCCCAAPVDLQGKSRAWINGSPATATQLRAVGDSCLTFMASMPGKA
jgi:DNA repair protein RecN (Recombination protein N)